MATTTRTRYRRVNGPYSVLAEAAPTAEVIRLQPDDAVIEVVRVKQGPYLLGYFSEIADMEAHLGLHGMSRLVLLP